MAAAIRLTNRPEIRALRLLARAAPGLGLAAAAFVLAEAALPNLVILAMGRATGAIPGAVEDGLGSAAGRHLLVALAVAGAVYALSLLRGPVEDALSAAVRERLAVALRRRVVAAVCAPAGIEHLDDPAVLDRLASATGELRGDRPADAPMTLLSLWGDRLGGLLSCVVLATFRWWAGALLLVVWLAVRRPASAFVVSRVHTFRRAGGALRHARYLLGLTTRAEAAKEVRILGLGDWLLARHERAWTAAMTPAWAELRRIDRRMAAVAMAVLAAYLACAGELGWAAYHGEVGLRTLATMLPMLPMSMQLGSITMADVQLASMLDALPDLDALTAGLAAAGPRRLAPLPPDAPAREIRLKDVAYRYPGADQDVLAGVSLTLPARRSLALVGLNGAGKTTLVALLAGLREPARGTIAVDGVPVGAVAWQRRVAVVGQDALRLPLSARDNVTLDLAGAGHDPAALQAAAERAGALAVIERLPRGWDTVLSPRHPGGVDLSGGQWQRLALARALYAVARGATVLVLDEPTAQLDVRAEAAFHDRFLELTAGTTTVVVSHRFSTVRRADRIAVLDGGRIAELGTHDELVAAGGAYAHLFALQAEARA